MASEFRIPGYIIETKGDWLVVQTEGSIQTFCMPSKSLISIAEVLLNRQGKVIVDNDAVVTEDRSEF